MLQQTYQLFALLCRKTHESGGKGSISDVPDLVDDRICRRPHEQPPRAAVGWVLPALDPTVALHPAKEA
ncbi:MAG: hypothetical protein JWR07_3653, partial [Nevskia sp.]|nr:hypothetical protein [Nevskia sp.]